MNDIVVIGGGAAGAAAFGELLNQSAHLHLHWIAGEGRLGRGVAYGTDDRHHLLNVRAAGMGVFKNHDEDFVQFANRNGGSAVGTDFLPRALFGNYVEEQIHCRTASATQRGQPFSIYREKAVSVTATTDGYRVTLHSGKEIAAARVILAIGTLPQRPLRSISAAALSSGKVELDPWCISSHPTPPRRLIVIGTGLTAVDVLLSAARQWPEAELIAVSRHGLLPLDHKTFPQSPYPFQSALNEALLSRRNVREMVRLVRAAIQESPFTDWRSVIDGMRTINAILWQQLDETERWRFLRFVRWAWEASRHRAAPAVAESIEHLRDAGRLDVLAARVLNVDGGYPLRITLRQRSTQLVTTLEADLIVQATGLDTGVSYADDGLLAQLLRDGVASPDPLQLGLAALPDGQLLNRNGAAQRGLYAIGPLLRGNLWECTAMPEIRATAHRLATRLTDEPNALGVV